MDRVSRKRSGYALIFVLCLMPVIFSIVSTAITFVFDFTQRTGVAIDRKNERFAIDRAFDDAIEGLIHAFTPDPPNGVEIKIQPMNYDVSSISDLNESLPPWKKSENGETHFFIQAERKTSGVLTYRTEAAVEVSGDNARVLWTREYVIH